MLRITAELPKTLRTIPTYIVYEIVTQCFGHEPLYGAMRFSLEPNNWLHSLHCRLFHGFEAAVNPLELRASSTIDACEQRQHAQARQQRRGRPLERVLPLSCRRGGTSSPSPAGSGGNPACGVGPERPDEGNLPTKASISSLMRPCGAPSPGGRRQDRHGLS